MMAQFNTLRSLDILLVALMAGCTAHAQAKQLNDPSKYSLTENVVWSTVDGFDLKMDIYTPTSGQAAYPVLVIFHGGGWLINDKSIMQQTAEYIATHGQYVVCNVDYRLLADQGNTVTMDQIVGDVFGAVLWIKTNISQHQGDPNKLAVTGDSAGAHLAATVVNLGGKLTSSDYSEQNLAFRPSYLPDGVTAEQAAAEERVTVQAAILSYGAFDLYADAKRGFESWANPFWYFAGATPRGMFGDDINPRTHPGMYKGVSPLHTVPLSTQRTLPPQLLTVGSDDKLTTPVAVRKYRDTLRAAGQPVEYWQHEGRAHAFLDAGSNSWLGVSFADDAPAALDVMLSFLDRVFYPDN